MTSNNNSSQHLVHKNLFLFTAFTTLLLLCVVPFSTCVPPNFDEAERSFTLNPRLSNRRAWVKKNDIYCDFRFSTANCDELEKQMYKKPVNLEQNKKLEKKKKFQDFYDKIHGDCFSKLQGYWTYKICVADSIVQFHDRDEYVLGQYHENVATKDTVSYTEGTPCEIGGKVFRRKSSVKFMCGTQSALVSAEEIETCVYSLVVIHPELCGDGSPFESYSGSIQGNSQVSTSRVTEEDHWFMSIEETANGGYICTVKNILRDLKEEPTSCFKSFSLQFYSAKDEEKVAGEEENDDSNSKHIDRYSIPGKRLSKAFARRNKREYFSSNELSVYPKSLKVSNSGMTGGSLEYLRIEM